MLWPSKAFRHKTDKRFAPNFSGSNQTVVVIVGKKHLNPQKLLMSKWTAVDAREKEKHFLVARVINPEAPKHKIQEVEMEAVMTKRRFILRWEELTDPTKWLQGWI